MRRGLGLAFAFAVTVPGHAAAPSVVPRSERWIERSHASARAEPVDLGDRSAEAARARAFLKRFGGTWEIAIDRRTGRAVRVAGSGIPWIAGRGNALETRGAIDLASLELQGRRFLADEGAWLEPEVGELVLDRQASTLGRDGRAIGLRFAWHVAGVPVEDAAVYLHINSGNLVQFGAPLVGHAPGDARPVVTERQAIERALDHGGDAAAYELRGSPALRFQPEENGEELLTYRLVWVVRYRVPGEIETWEARVDARTGEVVSFVDSNRYGRVVGSAYPRSWFEQNETRVPMPYANVTTEQGASASDFAGAFSYSGGLATAVLSGPWVVTDCAGCANPFDPLATVGGGTGRLDFGFGGVDATGNGASTPADRTSYYHLNQVRRIAKAWLPGLAWLDEVLVSHTNYPATCNAFYDGDVYFFRAGQGCGNTGEVSDIAYHEWGHGLDFHTAEGDGATGEGTADVVSMLMTHSALMGPGFFTDGSPVRNLDPNGPRGLLTTSNIGTKCPQVGELGPLGFELHCEGEILGQTAWDLALALAARHGARTGWREAERLFFTSSPFAVGYLPTSFPSVYDAYLLADDTDGNLSNGTPNGTDIFNAFSRHGIAGQNRGASPYCSRPAQPVVTVTPGCDRIDLSWTSVTGAARYVVLRQEPGVEALFEVATVVPPAPRTYSDHEIVPGIPYGYVVLAETASGCESRIESPISSQAVAQPMLTVTAATVQDTNGSGYADPDEEVDLSIELSNVGTAASGGGSGTLTSTSAVTLLDATAAWPGIAPGASAAGEDALRFRAVSPQAACADVLRIRLDPSAGGSCAQEPSWIDVTLGNPQGVCEPSPPCATPPTFAGLSSVVPGPGCGQSTLSWAAATRNCVNSSVRYDVYRSTSVAFAPGPENLVASGIKPTSYVDTGLWGGVTYFYAVRAADSLGGAEGNSIRLPIVPPSGPDVGPPAFTGPQSVSPRPGCGVIGLSWLPATEECGPVTYDVYRSPDDPFFLPGPPTFVGSTTSTTFEDSGLPAYTDFWYIVRARDSAGNESGPDTVFAVQSSGIDRTVLRGSFELSDDGWTFDGLSTATSGNWELGNPHPAPPFQSGDCPDGERCWITGLQSTQVNGQQNDVDGGSTILLTPRLGELNEPVLSPAFEYSYWVAGHPSTRLRVEFKPGNVFNPPFQPLTELAPLATPMWRRIRHPFEIDGWFDAGHQFRFVLSAFSLSSSDEAGIDDWAMIDQGRECIGCSTPPQSLGSIRGRRHGEDVVLEWDLGAGARFGVYVATTPGFTDGVRVGSTNALSFTHEGAAVAPQDLYYLVSAFDTCGNESSLY